MSNKNYYEVLGVSKDASEQDIKKAYRSLSLKFHPDRNNAPDAQSKFQEINQAYEVLSDLQTRTQYDAECFGNPFGVPNNMDKYNETHQNVNDIFNMVFGQMGGIPGGMHGGMHGREVHIFPGGIQFGGGFPNNIFKNLQKPPPIFKNIQITMEQSYHGCSIPVDIERWVIINGNKVIEKETVYVVIPPGIDETIIIGIIDKGHVANEEMKGDLKIGIQINNTTPFQRIGLDLIYKKVITLKESLCGFLFDFQHLNGKTINLNNTNMTIIKPNYIKTIPNMGMRRDTTIGNLIINFDVKFPDTLTSEQINILKEIL